MKITREKYLAVATALVVLGVGVLTLVVEPPLKERRARRARLIDLQMKLATLKGDLLVRNRIDKMYRQVEPFIAASGNDQQEMSVFTRELSDVYSNLNVKTRSVKLLPTVNEEFYRLLSVKIEMQGPIRHIMRFIQLVEAHASPLRIEQFGLKAREITDDVHASFSVTKVVAESGS